MEAARTNLFPVERPHFPCRTNPSIKVCKNSAMLALQELCYSGWFWEMVADQEDQSLNYFQTKAGCTWDLHNGIIPFESLSF
jgi:hypothetical protein